MTIPTIGRTVYYRTQQRNITCAAIVCDVKPPPNPGDTALVNLAVFDSNGDAIPVMLVPFHEADENIPPGSAGWMPYQLGQQQKTEEVQKVYNAEHNELVGQVRALTSKFDELEAKLNAIAAELHADGSLAAAKAPAPTTAASVKAAAEAHKKA